VQAAPSRDAAAFPVGAAVHHDTFGDGQVIRIDGDDLVVLFDEVGYRTLAAGVAVERSLLALR
jgi:ATP-dependent DNA helicase RecQ